MNIWRRLTKPPWRTIVLGVALLVGVCLAYLLWSPGLDVRDGRHDLGRNGIWLGHGWLGGDEWFLRSMSTNRIPSFRDPARIHELAARLRRHHITDVFPHLCPAEPDGEIPPVDAAQVERFLDIFEGFRVMPWVGGPNGNGAQLFSPKWRATFATNVQQLLASHPRLAGVHINIEPLTSGDPDFLTLLDDLRMALPRGKLLSVAAYPPPTRWHPYPDVHWTEGYFREVSRHSDQLAVMLYDAGQRVPRTYQYLMAGWTQEVLAWSEGKPVLLGVPTYTDAGAEYHEPNVENITNALQGIHRGLSRQPVPAAYQGVAIYCEWETSEEEWEYLREHFLTNQPSLIH